MNNPQFHTGALLYAAALFASLLISCPQTLAQNAVQPSGRPVSIASTYRAVLPPTNMDSFVRQSQEHAEHIYGDEGTYGPPPYLNFDKPHRINTGILDQRDRGITTGHGSWMPDAWGRDEFSGGSEFDQSGARGVSASMGYYAGVPTEMQDLGANPVDFGAGEGQANIPPPPGPGYQPCYQHGVFVGYYSPEEVALAQTDFPAALRSFVNSDRYLGGESGRLSILYEIGDVSSPFGT